MCISYFKNSCIYFSLFQLGRETEKYFNELSELGEFERIPPVQIAIYKDAHKRSIRDFKNFRKFAYRIKNDEEYELIELV